MADKAKENWHLDRRVPLGIIVMLLAQTFVIVWYGGQAIERLATVEERVEIHIRKDAHETSLVQKKGIEKDIEQILREVEQIKKDIREMKQGR